MPELPEVETIIFKLKQKVPGKTITEVIIENPKIIAYPDEEEFKQRLTGRTIKDITRRGKFINFTLDDDMVLVSHMRMTGRLYTAPEDFPPEKHTHLILKLGDSLTVRFVDPRRFGRFWLVKEKEAGGLTGMDKLGIDPLNDPVEADYLEEKFGKRKKAIKTLLLDQDTIAGIGNIYADEILHRAKIYPAKKGTQLTKEDFKNLAQCIPEILKMNLEECKNKADEKLLSLLNYQNSPTIVTYKHENKPCPECGSELVYIKVNGRGTCYCPNCQKKE